jgi:uncharacterized protein GlcG (DUF336 family)
VTLLVGDVDGATTWFETALDAHRLPELDHYDENGGRFAVILRVPGLAPFIQLRSPDGPSVSSIDLGVPTREDLSAWIAHFDGLGVEHSDIAAARAGHTVTFRVPGGPALRLYAHSAEPLPAKGAGQGPMGLGHAQTIVGQALAKARDAGLPPMTVAVVDVGGNLIAFGREDGSSLARERISRAKALSALNMGVGTRALAGRAASHPQFFTALAALTDGNMVPVPGGVLVRAAGQITGAVGVSGAQPDADETCAVHGIAAAGFQADAGL